MKNKYYKFSIVVFFIFTFLIFYYGLKQKNFYTPENISIKTLPNLFLKDFYTNNETSFNDILIDSNYYLINIWSSWCEPCRDESDKLLELKNDTTIMMIGINYKDKKKNALNFLKLYGNPFEEIFVDKQGTISINFGAYGVPETFLINNDNKVLKKYIGPLNDEDVYEIKKITKN